MKISNWKFVCKKKKGRKKACVTLTKVVARIDSVVHCLKHLSYAQVILGPVLANVESLELCALARASAGQAIKRACISLLLLLLSSPYIVVTLRRVVFVNE